MQLVLLVVLVTNPMPGKWTRCGSMLVVVLLFLSFTSLSLGGSGAATQLPNKSHGGLLLLTNARP